LVDRTCSDTSPAVTHSSSDGGDPTSNSLSVFDLSEPEGSLWSAVGFISAIWVAPELVG
jgi:hypothetical protein